ncbi:EF-P lysine aminoacylase GenX [Leptospira fainei serovar Hurstbridge str. BUT 6]|uniref:EF-P lysine aminoacylase GenX n=1 Tax=Leptospira fainei serovar Hurstbridge str. BUT 6 TaxID=1193011 RepID=S3UWS5_9LEPT|nr:EF-P lysine aminoacylase EpmA [Leptospira fainei]EPG72814.1 EF-P lysine aminoacylase GenX [Leptospira fainei serovar Hurstbridge str. BUT 6]
MNLTSKEIITARARFLRSTRDFFHSEGFLEIDTPALKKIPGMEPHLDPFEVRSPSGNEIGYLVTSPEYSLKQALSLGLDRVYEIAHTFRSGEKGSPLHTAEFLMLEFYQAAADLNDLMDTTERLIRALGNRIGKSTPVSKIPRNRVRDLLLRYAGCDWDRESLEKKLKQASLTNLSMQELEYEDCFYLVFLNFVEPRLLPEFQFLYDYPPEMAALARIENGVAKRFETYYGNIELGNAFYELSDPVEQRLRFLKEQELRKKLGKEVFPIDGEFLLSLERGLPTCSGNAIGLDRLLSVFLGANSLAQISPYWARLD